MTQWQEVSPQSDIWDFEKDGKILIGTYETKTENIPPNDSTLYHIRRENGEMRSIWESTVLGMKMLQVPIGAKIKIEYLGEKPSPKRKGANYRDFNIFCDSESVKGTTEVKEAKQESPICPASETEGEKYPGEGEEAAVEPVSEEEAAEERAKEFEDEMRDKIE